MADKKIKWTRVTADQKLLNGPGWLHSAFFVPSSAGGDVVIRDGADANGEIVIKMVSQLVSTVPLTPTSPIRLQKGLFIDWGTTADSLLVGYEAED